MLYNLHVDLVREVPMMISTCSTSVLSSGRPLSDEEEHAADELGSHKERCWCTRQ